MFKPNLWQIPTIAHPVQQQLAHKTEILIERLKQIAERHQAAKFASSLAVEDMLITDLIAKCGIPIEVFTLNTGRLNPETLALLEQVDQRYPNLTLQRYFPQAAAVQAYIHTQGENAFYHSVEQRQQCCFIRKVEPLNRALQAADAWLSGQRRDQSVTRAELPFSERDQARRIAKYNPIFDWSERDVWAYILHHQVPYNRLYQQGYPSIGCEPCTRPVKVDEDIRAGRWWWENKDSKECGLHTQSA
ncbi:phosphoadenylyl-sulfate reductase [Pasteurellaceae bacterium USgator11]|nr:phosphoadenylyl-sulfate reductase [Pasteurellaceae bacterium UScroc12]TNG96424.1 phosphoadenylyl-sulfate reductase [Pasteurellaceae bacterium USgator41]TNG99911.1 phosphoadenylyl-sulfate reductase [Pasteurellaceae bacterium UScroc31]TNH01649.1 phosphoadenylyl-sulfate reductase [Pasteurellaceae bacterium USgator11]